MSFGELVDKYQTALIVGISSSCAQVFFYLIFAKVLPEGIWRRDPGYLAHQVVCLPLMVCMAVLGVQGWFFPDAEAVANSTTVEGRVYGHNEIGELLAQIALGLALLWDTPCSLVIKSLRKPDSLAHHFGMAMLAYVCCSPRYCYYTPLVFGVIELSSIPLTLSEVFHPEYFPEFATMVPALGALNESVLRPLFAISFLLLRGIYLPFVGATSATPDTIAVIHASTSNGQAVGMSAVLALCWFFLALQAYWAVLILKQVVKALTKAREVNCKGAVEPLLA